MNPHESTVFNDFVSRVRDDYDLSVLLIEHDMSVIEAYLGRVGAREDRRNRS
jgi:branched-chain amino acid transport system ATP-binding protein